VPPRGLGLAVAGLLLATQSRELCNSLDVGDARWFACAAIPVLVALAALRPRLTGAQPPVVASPDARSQPPT
jgi:hypothetical protein